MKKRITVLHIQNLLFKYVIPVTYLISVPVFAQKDNRIELGRLQTGSIVSFLQNAENEWGIEIAEKNAPRIFQPQPVRIEIFKTEDNIQKIVAGYKTVRKSKSEIVTRAEIPYNEHVIFHIDDYWSLNGAILPYAEK